LEFATLKREAISLYLWSKHKISYFLSFLATIWALLGPAPIQGETVTEKDYLTCLWLGGGGGLLFLLLGNPGHELNAGLERNTLHKKYMKITVKDLDPSKGGSGSASI
jgi:hypothetical protein